MAITPSHDLVQAVIEIEVCFELVVCNGCGSAGYYCEECWSRDGGPAGDLRVLGGNVGGSDD